MNLQTYLIMCVCVYLESETGGICRQDYLAVTRLHIWPYVCNCSERCSFYTNTKMHKELENCISFKHAVWMLLAQELAEKHLKLAKNHADV